MGASFALFRYAEKWPEIMVSTVLAMAAMAMVGNLLYWIAWVKMKKLPGGMNNKAAHVFILLSTLLQTVSLFLLSQQ